MKNLIEIPKKFNNFLKSYWLKNPAIGVRRILFFYLMALLILCLGIIFNDYLLIFLVLVFIIGMTIYFYRQWRNFGYYHRWFSKDKQGKPTEVVDFFIEPGTLFRREEKALFILPYERVYKSKRGKRIVFRFPRKDDTDSYLKFFNNLIAEDVLIRERIEKISKIEAEERIKSKLGAIRESRGVNIFAFFKGRMIAQAVVTRKKGKQSHVGELEIAVSKGFRNESIGTKLVEELVVFAKNDLCLKLIKLGVLSNNLQAIRLYKKHGFKMGGRIPRGIVHRKRYVDELMMYKELN